MKNTRSISDFAVFQILKYLHKLYQLKIPNLKIQNLSAPIFIMDVMFWIKDSEHFVYIHIHKDLCKYALYIFL
jgi:hypothetical protein